MSFRLEKARRFSPLCIEVLEMASNKGVFYEEVHRLLGPLPRAKLAQQAYLSEALLSALLRGAQQMRREHVISIIKALIKLKRLDTVEQANKLLHLAGFSDLSDDVAHEAYLVREGILQKPRKRGHIFLCHASEDKPAIRQLYRRLCADGFIPWLDEEDLLPGQDWQEEIPRAVRRSDIILVCLSSKSITKRGYVQKEIKYALDVADEQPFGTTFLVPVKLEECEIPDRLRRWQWLNLFESGAYERLKLALREAARATADKSRHTTLSAMDLDMVEKYAFGLMYTGEGDPNSVRKSLEGYFYRLDPDYDREQAEKVIQGILDGFTDKESSSNDG
jgi:hypothetical protein